MVLFFAFIGLLSGSDEEKRPDHITIPLIPRAGYFLCLAIAEKSG